MNGKVTGCIFALLLICSAGRASAQECPKLDPAGPETASQTRTLEGRLIYHNDIRQWFELKLNDKQCGESSIQMTVPDGGWEPLQFVRGCQVESIGKLHIPLTGYFSANLYQDVTRVDPVGACRKKPPFRDYSNASPDRRIRAYRVDMDVDYRPADHPIIFHVRSGSKELRPWQAYASYQLTGSFVLYGQCGRGFVVNRVYGTPAARPAHFDEPRASGDMAAFDPETAAQAGKTNLHLGYSCVRAHSG